MAYMYPYGDSQQLNLSWFLAKFKELYEYVMQLDPSGEPAMDVILSRFTEQYDSTRTYIPGDYCIYDGYIYKANTTTGGTFDSSAWDAALPVNDVQGLRILLGGLSTDLDALEQNAVTNVQYTPGAATADGLLRQTKNGAAETVMTVDKEPTENSQNPVKSGAVYEELDELKGSLNSLVIVGDNTPFTAENIPSNAILKGTFILSSEYTMSEKQILVGEGATITVSGNGKITMNKYCTIENVNFVGDYNPTRTTSGAHLVPIMTETNLANQTYITGSTNQGTSNVLITCTSENSVGIKVIGCSFSNLDKLVVMINGGNHTSDTGFIISNNYFNTVWNAVGIYGEFGHINGNTFVKCIIGITVSSGIAEKCNNTFKQCDVGIYYIAAVGNMAHGTMSGCNIAHCGLFAIYIKTISAVTGEIIVGCQIAEGGVKAEVANNLMIISCRLDTWFNIVSGANNKIADNIIRTAYLDGHSLFTVPQDTEIYDNIPIGDATWDAVNPIHTHFVTFTTGDGLTGTANGIFDPRTCTVRVRGYVYMAENISTSKVLFIAPEGFRPTSNFPIFMECTMENGSTVPYFGIIKPNGEITQNLGNTVQKILLTGEYPTHSS